VVHASVQGPFEFRGADALIKMRSGEERPRMRLSAVRALLVLTVLGAAVPGVAQAPDAVSGIPAPGPQDRYDVFLLTMDQGDAVWELFGHNAILIRDRETGQDLAWNWGLFSFEAENFILRFLQGTMTYSMGPSELGAFLASYQQANRTVYANELVLTQDEARRLDEFVRWNFAPENRGYVYNYFLDNCSTRVRDVLDGILGGVLRQRFESVPTERSYRWHVRRLVQDRNWLEYGLHFLLGPRADVPISEWATMFIPMDMMRLLEEFERSDGAGGTTPLLGPREVLIQATRPGAPASAPPFSPWSLGIGLAGGILFVALGRGAARGTTWAFRGLAATALAWGLVSGVLGLLVIAIAFTHHIFGHWNPNLLLVNPLTFAAGGLTVAAALRGGQGAAFARYAAWAAVGIAGASLLVALAGLAGVFVQQNGEIVALAVPLNLGLAAALAMVIARPAVRPERARSTQRKRGSVRGPRVA
jgi:hypothetical protein